MTAPISVLIPTRNESANIGRCLEELHGWADEIVVVDSQSSDNTVQIAESFGAKVIQFYYTGGLPKKRQWALDTYPFRNEWILLLDADEIVEGPIRNEIGEAIKTTEYDGYWLRFQIYFLGRRLKYGDTQLWKLFLFRKGKGRYEKRLDNQDRSMSDIEVHEHIIVSGKTGRLKNPIRHENVNSMSRYISKHNEYSNWEAGVFIKSSNGEIKSSLFGSQAQRRRWLRTRFFCLFGSPFYVFLYKYFIRYGFMDGKQGFIYSLFQAIQVFHTKSKIFELRNGASQSFFPVQDRYPLRESKNVRHSGFFRRLPIGPARQDGSKDCSSRSG
ncbi:MAG TPA: glycosyltransferase family 2 protein [Syntrophobacteraceae bacterium]|nr:glycosyltransferase family 2 protein [Syntrophobacteraceae bacterium]